MNTRNMTDEQKVKVLEYELVTAKHEARNAEIRWVEMVAQYWELKPKYDELLNQWAYTEGLNERLTTENKKLRDEVASLENRIDQLDF